MGRKRLVLLALNCAGWACASPGGPQTAPEPVILHDTVAVRTVAIYVPDTVVVQHTTVVHDTVTVAVRDTASRARPTSTKRIPIFKEAQGEIAPRVDTVTMYKTDTITLTVSRMDTVVVTGVATQAAQQADWGGQLVYFATDRQREGKWNPGPVAGDVTLFGYHRGTEMTFGSVRVSIPKGHRSGEVERPALYTLLNRSDPERYMRPLEIETMQSGMFYRALRSRLNSTGAGALVYIHGFNNTFEDALLRTAQIAHDLNFDGPAIAYSWPARHNPLLYVADRNDAEWSAAHLRQFLDSLGAVVGNRPVVVIAHSTGAFILSRAVQLSSPRPVPRLSNLVLAAPDLDADVFKTQIMPAFRAMSSRTTLYASTHDIPLFLSRELGGGNQRAGEIKPQPVIVNGLDTIDASSGSIDLLGHSIAFEDRALLDDLYYLIVKGLPPGSRHLRPQPVGQGTVWVVP